MFSNPLFIIILILIISILILFIYKNSVEQKRCNQPYFAPVQKNINNSKYIEDFNAKTAEYNSMYGGKEIWFKSAKESDGTFSFFVYLINNEMNQLVELDIFKNNENSLDNSFLSYNLNDDQIGKVSIIKPTSIRTDLKNNVNYVTSFKENKVYKIDLTSKLDKKGIDIPTGPGPTYIDIYRTDNNNTYGYTSNYNNNTVSILNLKENKNIGEITVGKNPSFVCVAEKSGILFVANYTDNSINCYNLTDPKNPEKIEIDNNHTGKGPSCIEITPEEDKIYITNHGDGTISVFNISNKKKIIKGKDIKVPNNAKPYSIDFNTTNKIGVILTNNGIYIIDSNTDKLSLVIFSDKENEEMGTITSVRYRYYKENDIEYLFIKNNKGELFRKIINDSKKEQFNNFKPFLNYTTF